MIRFLGFVSEDKSSAGADCSIFMEKWDADVIIDIIMIMYGNEQSEKRKYFNDIELNL